MSAAYNDTVTFLHSDASVELGAAAPAGTNMASVTYTPSKGERYFLGPNGATAFKWYESAPAFETFVSPQFYDKSSDRRRLPEIFIRFSTPLALTLKQHCRLMWAIRERKDWIKQA